VDILSCISNALESLFDDLASELKAQVLSDLSQCFQSIAYSFSVCSSQLSTPSLDEYIKKKPMLSLLAYNITSLFLSLQLCKEQQIREIILYDSDLTVSFVVLIQTLKGNTLNDSEKIDLYLEATFTQALQCLRFCLKRRKRCDAYEEFISNVFVGGSLSKDGNYAKSDFVQLLQRICNDDSNPLNVVLSRELIRLIL